MSKQMYETLTISKQDEEWISSVLSLIPKGVYYGGAQSITRPEPTRKKKWDKSVSSTARGQDKTSGKKKTQAAKASDENPGRAMLRKKLEEKLNALRAERRVEEGDGEQKQKKTKEKVKKDMKHRKDVESKRDVPSTSLETSMIKGFENEPKPEKRRRPGISKLKDLQQKLAKATKERDLKKDADGQSTAHQLEVDKAMARIKGEKVKDDVLKLKKTIRKEKRKSVKSRQEWAKRVKSVERDMKARQEKREKNLKERREAKKNGGSSKSGKKGKSGKKSNKAPPKHKKGKN